ncbi:disintegrin and metalloproteinase domain-containing protein 9-like isoform X2 [Hemitrygon akajei]|uniref:disintegrin and metalloproteinase domain-containing protein 9-like isoform X2 n=1 Tax=Hemitrygon akajei TaxID=2704970 RepID=UPI003BF98268
MARGLITGCPNRPSSRMLLLVELSLLGLCVSSGAGKDKCASSQQTPNLPGYEITIPKLIPERTRRDVAQRKDKVSYSIVLEGKTYILKLEKNKKLLTKDFVQYTFGKGGKMMSSQPELQIHCYYHGIVEGIRNSKVLLSTCVGIRGIIYVLEKGFVIEPLGDSSTFEHLVYRMEDLEAEPSVCGVSHHNRPATHNHHHLNNGRLSQNWRVKRVVSPKPQYVELVLVVDNDKFNLHNRNETLIQNQMVELVHLVDGMFDPLNVDVILTGLVIWKDENQIEITSKAGEVLGNFVQWRQRVLLPAKQHDSGHLILGKAQFGRTLGLAYVSTVCSSRLGGGIDVFANSDVARAATLLAHELGHNMGIGHDGPERHCKCSDSSCIMSPTLTNSMEFSNCSEKDFVNLIANAGGLCLRNQPGTEDYYSFPFCGNNIVDEGEECDCGTPENCKNPCCNAVTCTLKSGSDCAQGRCCKDCKFLPAGTLCRAVTDVCDLPEYCNGSSSSCQPDVFVQNGYPCANATTYCYEGVCQTYDMQCQILFGPISQRAPDACFLHANIQGDRFGNCGYQSSGFVKCPQSDVDCGKIQCIKATTSPAGVDTSTIFVSGHKCVNANFHVGTDVVDPSYVNTGTGCGKDKVCKDFKCAKADVLGYDCNETVKCNGHGICNNKKNCHCSDGWAPPDCATKGYGGSIDSGPTRIDTSLRDGLLIFFLLVVPVLLLIGLLIFFKRNAIKQLWRKRNSSGRRAQNKQQQQNTYANRDNQKIVATVSTPKASYYENITQQWPGISTENQAPSVPRHQIPVVPPKPLVPPRPTVPPRS